MSTSVSTTIASGMNRTARRRAFAADGLKATMLLMNGLVQDFNFAARIKRGLAHAS